MRKIIGVGETILDIIIRDGRPTAAVPGGSCFNSIISLGRAGIPCCFAGYSGDDRPGRHTRQMLEDNGVDTSHFQLRPTEKSAVSLAYIDPQGDADYQFYKTAPSLPDHWQWPPIGPGDVVLIGSYFAICDTSHGAILRMLREARQRQAVVYYDLNFRRSHQHELDHLLPAIHQNMRLASVVRGSADDFEVMYGSRDPREIYERHISPHCPLLLFTAGEGTVSVLTPRGRFDMQAPRVDHVVSTVGAGDNFNAGFTLALVRRGIDHGQLALMAPADWEPLLLTACRFAGEACRSESNYVSREFARAAAASDMPTP